MNKKIEREYKDSVSVEMLKMTMIESVDRC